MTPAALSSLKAERSYRIEERRDYISDFNFRVILTGQSVGGYGVLKDSFGGKFYHRRDARKAGEIWNELGIIPAFQTDERIAQYREAERFRALGAVKILEAAE